MPRWPRNSRSRAARAAPAPVPHPPAATPAANAATRCGVRRQACRWHGRPPGARAKGVEFEIPLYKYESLFKPLEDLLEKKPEPPVKAAKATKPAAAPAAKPSTK